MSDNDEAETLSPEAALQVWKELDACVWAQSDSHEAIDDRLRTWLDLSATLHDRTPHGSQEEVLECVQQLVAGSLFQENREYVRTQIIHSLLQEDESGPLHAISCMLLLDGYHGESTFSRMIAEACFPRLIELINGRRDHDPRLHHLLLQLMYEMSRMERLRVEDLSAVQDEFIHYLFGIIEGLSDDAQDPYHYPTIRVLLVLNEQYMLASTDSPTDSASQPAPLTNRIIKCLGLHGPSFRTFGENIILLLNRESETSLQLLILKLLYLLFTTKATYEFFYTNDLRVLLDVIIRNLMDLPDERISLRHTYLRVLYPLLTHTQLSHPPYYKRDEILRVLDILRGSHNAHFAPADETTLRLVERVSKVKWLEEDEAGSGEAEVARKFLGISLSRSETSSSISVSDVAGVMELPGVKTPSRKAAERERDEAVGLDPPSQTEAEAETAASKQKKPVPAVPRHRHGIPFSLVVNGQPKKVPPKAPPPRRKGKKLSVEPSSVAPIQETAQETAQGGEPEAES